MDWIVPLISVLIGGALTILGTIWTGHVRDTKQSKTLEAALIAEISGLLEIIEKRQYLLGFERQITYLRFNPDETRHYRVMVPKHYSRIYQETSKNIGILDANIAREIVKFHQLLDAVVQDITPDGHLYNGGRLHAFSQTKEIFDMAYETGLELTNNNRKKTCKPLNFKAVKDVFSVNKKDISN